MIRKSAAARKQQGEASVLAPKVVLKVVNKRKMRPRMTVHPRRGQDHP